MNAKERREFVRSHRIGVFGYNRREHGPAMSVVYYVMDGDDILISTMAERAKAKAVARNGPLLREKVLNTSNQKCAKRWSREALCSSCVTTHFSVMKS